MSHHRALKQRWLTVGVLALLLAGLEGLSFANRCLPPTPNPCAADGICRPQGEWGYSKTRWRPWPGEPIGQQPTAAEGSKDEADDPRKLGPYDLPTPEQEDLRGPVKEKAARKEDAEEAPVGDIVPDLPGLEAIPGPAEPAVDEDDPFGNNVLPAPSSEDLPPALPASLRQAARALNMPTLTTHQQPAPIQPEMVKPMAATPVAEQPIRQASWVQPAIGLVNPASAIVTDAASAPLQQAIYFEASDLDEE